uniref:Uncharacterized protein n=1 Tax=Rhizophora mucronata TaxID=61149 RepID=A0A2P2P4J9_RHIMU
MAHEPHFNEETYKDKITTLNSYWHCSPQTVNTKI